MLTLLLASLTVAVSSQAAPPSVMFTVDCSKAAGPCNNDCYAVFLGGSPGTLTWNNPTRSDISTNRKNAGCDPTPCDGSRDIFGSANDTSCDEYPFAASAEGGTGSILRCTDPDENTNEGGQFGRLTQKTLENGGCYKMAGCRITMAFDLIDNSPYCSSDRRRDNDGLEFELLNGEYEKTNPKNRRDLVGAAWRLHEPDPLDFMPLHLRRELLLDNGSKVLLVTRDLETSWENQTIITDNGTARVVKELQGMEKSPQFRPPGL